MRNTELPLYSGFRNLLDPRSNRSNKTMQGQRGREKRFKRGRSAAKRL